MMALFEQIFGVYSPITYIDASGAEVIASGMAGVNWTYLLSVLLFAIVLFSFFKLLGVLLKWK